MTPTDIFSVVLSRKGATFTHVLEDPNWKARLQQQAVSVDEILDFFVDQR
jgi:hypothetical protein